MTAIPALMVHTSERFAESDWALMQLSPQQSHAILVDSGNSRLYVFRNVDGKKVTEAHVAQLANWQPNAERTDEGLLVQALLCEFLPRESQVTRHRHQP